MRTLATVCATLCAAVMSFGVMAGVACSSGAGRSAGGNVNEVKAVNSSNRTGDSGNTSNAAESAPAADAAAQATGLDFRADVRREAGGEIVIEYSVTNRGARAVLLVNRGDTSFGLGPGRVYVEPREDGTVDFTQRGYTLPPGHSGPGPTAAIYPGVSELAPGKTASETLRVRAPKSRQHPYGRYYPQTAVPDPVRRARFCLGVVKGDAQTKTTRGTRVLTSLQDVAAQELLCSAPRELN
ncbi:MAG TPA: hypothetical protein VN282_07235 [Pyrinomonadaceae bacterium]|nr:hypothetical protein [Pyrinomonadaceae bacterium]